MAASIAHRASGVALYAGAILLGVWFSALALGAAAFAPIAALLNSLLGQVVMFGFAWSLFFHTFNGLRHFYWDSGRGLAPKTAALTSWFIFAASAVAAIGVFIAAQAQDGMQ